MISDPPEVIAIMVVIKAGTVENGSFPRQEPLGSMLDVFITRTVTTYSWISLSHSINTFSHNFIYPDSIAYTGLMHVAYRVWDPEVGDGYQKNFCSRVEHRSSIGRPTICK